MHGFVSLMYHSVVQHGKQYPELGPSVTAYFVDQATFNAQVTELFVWVAVSTWHKTGIL